MDRVRIIAAVLLFSFLTACSYSPGEVPSQDTEIQITSMEKEPELSYEIPASTPGILVNQKGYLTNSKKLAIFCGGELPDTFYVVNAKTRERIYTGTLKKGGRRISEGESVSYGDFTELTEPGSYYIEASVLGYSYPFQIGENLYDQVFTEACKQYYYNRCGVTLTEEYAGERAHNACHAGKAVLREDISATLDVGGGWHQDEKGSKDVAAAAQNIGIMLLAYELHGSSFGDDMQIPESGNGTPDILDEIRYEIEWLLKMQDEATGAVYRGITVYEQQSPGKPVSMYVEPVDMNATRAFSMALAKFSYLYLDYDAAFATDCLKAADRAWKYIRLNEGKAGNQEAEYDDCQFAAAAELYRASGKQEYHNYVVDYLRNNELEDCWNETVFLGCATYISTRQKVQLELCESIVNLLLEKAEEITERAKSALYLVTAEEEQAGQIKMLSDMLYLTMVNHIITNQEYENMIEDHLHYLMGRNRESLSYLDGIGEKSYHLVDESQGIMKQFDADSKLIFMLSEVVGGYNH